MSTTVELELTDILTSEGIHGLKRDKNDEDGSSVIPTNVDEVSQDRSQEIPLEYSRREDLSLPPVDTGRHAWLFCVSACMLETFIWGWNTTYGIFQDFYSSHPPFNTSSQAAISVIGTTSLAIQYLELLITMPIMQRYPEYAKRSMWIGLVIAMLSLFLSSFATKLWHLILLQGVIFGISAGAAYAPVLMWISEWFVERRGLATGIIFGGSGVGGFFLPLVMGYLLDGVGFRWTLRIWALILSVTCGLSLLGVNPRIPIKRPSSMPLPRKPWLPTDLKSVKSPLLYSMLGICVIQALGYFPVSLFIPTYTSSLSENATLPSTITLALFNVTSVISYLVIGRVCDSYPYEYVIMVSGGMSAISAFLIWGFASSLGLVFAFAVVFGVFSGGFPAIWPAAASKISGNRDHITSLAMGSFAAVKSIGAIVGPIIAASLHDTGETAKTVYGGFGFRNVEIFVGSMGIATSLGAGIMLWQSTDRKKRV